jgi:hypothetical protein
LALTNLGQYSTSLPSAVNAATGEVILTINSIALSGSNLRISYTISGTVPANWQTIVQCDGLIVET